MKISLGLFDRPYMTCSGMANVAYLRKRYLCKNDTFYWKKYLAETDNPVLWIDYSQNLAFKEKQAQSVNYSGRQQTIHNTLLQMPHGDEGKYIDLSRMINKP